LAGSSLDVEAPPVVAADEDIPVELALSEERALVRAASVECPQRLARPYDDDVDAGGRDCVRPVIPKLVGAS